MTTGEKIAALRREMGLSQESLADKLGLSRQAVSKWEADQTVPGMENLVELAKLFGVPVDTLLRPDEPLPGKPEEAPERMYPNGYTISYKPELTKKTKWFIWFVSALIAAGVLCSIISLVWLERLQKQVDGMPAGTNTVYVPGMDMSAQQSDFTSIDNQVRYDGENLQFSCKVMPRESGGQAWFVLQGGETVLEAQAIEENGILKAEIPAPPAQTYTLILRQQQDGQTRNLEVETFYSLNELYELGDTWVHAPLSWSGGMLAAFTVTVDVQPGGYYPESQSIVPTGGHAVLYIAGEPVETQKLEIAENADPIWHNEDGPVPFNEGSTQLCAAFSAHECPSIEEAEVRVTLTDKFGHEYEYSSNDGYE